MVVCSVDYCKSQARFNFPKISSDRDKWLRAIRRPDLKPKGRHGLCINHFRDDQFSKESFRSGMKLERKRLSEGAVPSIFEWPNDVLLPNSAGSVIAAQTVEENCNNNTTVPDISPEQFEADDYERGTQFNHAEYIDENPVPQRPNLSELPPKIMESATDNTVFSNDNETSKVSCLPIVLETKHVPDKKKYHSKISQTNNRPRYDIEDFKNQSGQIYYLTGLESYDKFMTVLYSLGPRVHSLNYIGKSVKNISVPNQLFLTLWKLRRNCADIELAMHFGIGSETVRNIFNSCISFMEKQWSLINTWPSRDLVDYYMPQSFKKHYKTTRVIIDGTEIPTHKPKNPKFQQATYSTYKNTNTLKVMVGCTPSGLISYCSPAYGGSTSDRQIVERSSLIDKCSAGDAILADRGFTVQDIFAHKNVNVLTPAFMKGKGHLSGQVLLNDRRLSKHRVHVERIIGLLKTYKILSTKLNHYHIPICSEIVGVCVMLCNFRECIISKN